MKKKTRIYLTGLLLVSIGAASLVSARYALEIDTVSIGVFIVKYEASIILIVVGFFMVSKTIR